MAGMIPRIEASRQFDKFMPAHGGVQMFYGNVRMAAAECGQTFGRRS